jgi:hypothetical protein
MVHVNTERLVAQVSAQVSAIDGIQYDIYNPQTSAFMGTFVEFMQKLMTRIDTPSAAIISGGSVAAVTVNVTQTASGGVVGSGIYGRWMGWPFHFLSGGSASPTASAATTSVQARKVLVVMNPGEDLPVASSLATTAPTLGFVYGSAYTTAALAASTGGVSSIFNLIPLPKASAGEIPVGWLNIHNSYTVSDGLADHNMITDYREIQGYDFSSILGTIQQP